MADVAKSSLRRTACDRCRAQKLRCLRDGTQPKCTRCTRLGVACEVGRAGRPGRPRRPDVTATAASSASTRGDMRPADGFDNAVQNAIDASSQDCVLGNEYLPLGGGHHFLDDFTREDGDDTNLQSAMSPPPRQDDAIASTSGTQEVVTSRSYFGHGTEFTGSVDQHGCLRELSRLNIDLHAQTTVLRENRASVDVAMLVTATHPPKGDGVTTICERALTFTQKFHDIIDNLDSILKNRSMVHEPSGALFHYAEDPLLADMFAGLGPSIAMSEGFVYTTGQDEGPSSPSPDTPVVLLLVSCYVQIIELFEIIFVHIHRRLKHLDTDPIPYFDPAKGLRIGTFYSCDGRLESIIYTQVVACLLDRVERGLGLLPDPQRYDDPGPGFGGRSRCGLLSRPHHFDLLQRELGQKGPGTSARPRALRDAVENARLIMATDTSW
ncbi:hypothetical protein DL764_003142 [Monosporascus ibericus]|uniref:Zn(2)-C6 fungal-type domain-containing protein n=1 Tax=Monosporascus ibericus TaxID=155417 RepID=A0A4Q4THT0_9PEZI|nr:hypothetical protein DL764_003142 [Monosporascus ibericus]